MTGITAFKRLRRSAAGADVPPPGWLLKFARTGHAARGTVYLLIGGLAFLAALGTGGQTGGPTDALRATLDAPGGWVLLIAIALGLVAFAVWRAFGVWCDPQGDGVGAKSIFRRLGYAGSLLAYLALAFTAVRLALGGGSGQDTEKSTQGWTGWLMSYPAGRWMVAAIGATIVIVGAVYLVQAWRCAFEDGVEIPEQKLKYLRPICRFGIAARGMGFVIVGGFFIYAGWTYDADKAGGMQQVLDQTRGQPFGQILLALLAAGLFAFGVYGIIQAIYLKVRHDA